MKKTIKVKEEWREDIYLVEKEEIIKYIKNLKQKYIHNLSWVGSMMFWADWDKDSVIKTINKSNKIALLFWKNRQKNFWHSLAVIVKNELEMFDLKIEKENININ